MCFNVIAVSYFGHVKWPHLKYNRWKCAPVFSVAESLHHISSWFFIDLRVSLFLFWNANICIQYPDKAQLEQEHMGPPLAPAPWKAKTKEKDQVLLSFALIYLCSLFLRWSCLETEGWHLREEARACVKQWDARQEGSCSLLCFAEHLHMLEYCWNIAPEQPWKLLLTQPDGSCLISAFTSSFP